MAEKIIRERMLVNKMEFAFMPGKGTTDAILILSSDSYKKNIKQKKKQKIYKKTLFCIH